MLNDQQIYACTENVKNIENGKVTKYNISFHSSTTDVTVYLQNCYVGDTLITEENVKSLLNINSDYNKVVVANSVD